MRTETVLSWSETGDEWRSKDEQLNSSFNTRTVSGVIFKLFSNVCRRHAGKDVTQYFFFFALKNISKSDDKMFISRKTLFLT